MLFGLFTLKHVPVKFFLERRSCQLALTCVSFIPSKRYSELPFIPSCSSYFFQNEERFTKNVKKTQNFPVFVWRKPLSVCTVTCIPYYMNASGFCNVFFFCLLGVSKMLFWLANPLIGVREWRDTAFWFRFELIHALGNCRLQLLWRNVISNSPIRWVN